MLTIGGQGVAGSNPVSPTGKLTFHRLLAPHSCLWPLTAISLLALVSFQNGQFCGQAREAAIAR